MGREDEKSLLSIGDGGISQTTGRRRMTVAGPALRKWLRMLYLRSICAVYLD